jgi:gliding motility-associated-like protein
VIQWNRKFGGTGFQLAYDIARSTDGGFILAGYNNGTPSVSDSSNIYVIKTDSLGNTPGCTTGSTTATVTTPSFSANPSFVWSSVTNLSFSPTAITPVSANPNPFTNTLCSSTCEDTIINAYTPVVSLDKCKNILTVEDGTAFNTGDTVLLIQMKGAVIDSTNTAAFGTITDYKNAGNYEFNYVKTRAGNIIELKNTITRQYDVPNGKVQLVRVPYYQTANFTATLTCLPWDGKKGGVLVLNAQDLINLNANIDVSGKGFRGGIDPFSNPGSFFCYENQFYYPVNPDLASGKGEGIADISPSRSFGKGALANGGGGGNSHNSGGGGGANAATGGFGGYNFEGSPCNGTVPFDNRGIGGRPLTYSNAANKIFLGGGGGAGHTNNPEAFQATGGNGSGIVIIIADKLKANANKILANGYNAAACGNTGSGCHEGMGGGGAGGTTLLKINNYLDAAVVEIKGGNGANMTSAGNLKVGPGGGGSGGTSWLTNPSLPAVVTVTLSGGQAGVCTAYSNDPWGATAGQLGSTLFNLVVPVDNIPFRPNIDSVRIKDSATSCKAFDFKGLGYTNTNPVANWQWFFGDGGTANTQNTSHTYGSAGTFTVKLIITDINGCKDSITKAVTAIQFSADAGNDTALCSVPPISVTLHASAGSSYSWTPAIYLNNPNLQNPTATISTTTRFYVTITNFPGCTATDSVLITLAPTPANVRYPTITALINQPTQLQARNLGGNSYNWQPTVGLNNNLIINPVFTYSQTQEYRIYINTLFGCQVVDTQLVKINGKKGIYVPRAFSPNGDGINDRLYPILVGIRELYYFRVYNRWGNLLFVTNSGNPASGWDGTFKGSLQPVETYTWVAEGIDIDGIVIKKSGNTVLLR